MIPTKFLVLRHLNLVPLLVEMQQTFECLQQDILKLLMQVLDIKLA